MYAFSKPIAVAALVSITLSSTVNAGESTAKPDPTQVARFEANSTELSAKLAECKKKGDLAAVLTDTSCMSAEEVLKRRQHKMIVSKCSSSETFVFVPPNIKGDELEKYLLSHAPPAEILRKCGQSKEQWLQGYLGRASKK